MNENCPREAANLTNTSQHFQEVSGLKFNTSRDNVRKYLYFDELPDDIKAKQIAASNQMHSLGKQPINDFTFIILYCLVWAKKVMLAAICLDISSASFGIRIN
jgi:hypothetical protein